ncbi:hypothetical protein N7539_007159 [Penicillium diatomitis]|uniref:Uncharacterized protein n=1 Tax=Penicillium diatomitis TaxID=2819901 RepID=A0A9W9WUK6_9EURO|nr:uncharacterized protein N7539_007159 [Penicillium diatomitis]KAJ5477015.1 hypothetical protein N7539_007159 [Penicillium diatomitis]
MIIDDLTILIGLFAFMISDDILCFLPALRIAARGEDVPGIHSPSPEPPCRQPFHLHRVESGSVSPARTSVDLSPFGYLYLFGWFGNGRGISSVAKNRMLTAIPPPPRPGPGRWHLNADAVLQFGLA